MHYFWDPTPMGDAGYAYGLGAVPGSGADVDRVVYPVRAVGRDELDGQRNFVKPLPYDDVAPTGARMARMRLGQQAGVRQRQGRGRRPGEVGRRVQGRGKGNQDCGGCHGACAQRPAAPGRAVRLDLSRLRASSSPDGAPPPPPFCAPPPQKLRPVLPYHPRGCVSRHVLKGFALLRDLGSCHLPDACSGRPGAGIAPASADAVLAPTVPAALRGGGRLGKPRLYRGSVKAEKNGQRVNNS